MCMCMCVCVCVCVCVGGGGGGRVKNALLVCVWDHEPASAYESIKVEFMHGWKHD